MAIDVKVSVNNEDHTLKNKRKNIYETVCTAPEQGLKTTESGKIYPIVVTATDDAGNETVDSSTSVNVEREFGFEFIMADQTGAEIGFWTPESVDVEVSIEDDSESNTFENTIGIDAWKAEWYAYGNRIYIPDTEYGGLIEDINPVTASNLVYIRGLTWRGLLDKKIIVPREGEVNYTVSGDLNDIIRELVGDRYGTLFYVPEQAAGVTVSAWKIDRYVSVYKGIQKLLDVKEMRLNIRYSQQEKAVELKAVPVKDYSGQIEVSQDCNVDFDIRDCRTGINHLICGGQGEGAERLIVDLYVQEDGSIGRQQYYTGLSEREQFYDYSSAESEETLITEGIKQLESLRNYKKFGMTINNMDLELGDIVGGREYITGTKLQAPVVRKILSITGGEISLEYKLKGVE